MIKAQFTKEQVQGFGLGLAIEFCRVKVQSPYKGVTHSQPTFTLAMRFAKWQFYLIIYKPANVTLNRHDRRRLHIH